MLPIIKDFAYFLIEPLTTVISENDFCFKFEEVEVLLFALRNRKSKKCSVSEMSQEDYNSHYCPGYMLLFTDRREKTPAKTELAVDVHG